MSDDKPTNGDRVTNRQLYEELAKIPSRREVYLILLGGQAVASGVTAAITRMSPPQQATALAHFALHLL